MWRKYISILCVFIVAVAICVLICACQNSQVNSNEIDKTKCSGDLFDDRCVHNIRIIIPEDEWEELKETALDKKWFDCDVEIDGELLEDIAIRTKGGSTLEAGSEQQVDNLGFKIEFDHNKNQRYQDLDKLVLNNSIFDDTFVRDYIAYDMMRFIGVPASRTTYVNLFVNDVDLGLYLGIEAVEDRFLERNYGDDYGSLYKGRPRLSDNLEYIDDNISSYDWFSDLKTDASYDDMKRMVQVVKNISSPDTIEKAVNIDEVIKFFIIETFLCHYDGYFGIHTHNYYLYEKDGVIEMIPWDYDGIYYFSKADTTLINEEEMNYVRVNMPIDTPAITIGDEERVLWKNIMENPDNVDKYHKYYLNFLRDYFDSGYFEQKMNDVYNVIYPYLKDDQNAFHSTEQFVGCFNWIKNLMLDRRISIERQINGEYTEEDRQKVIDLLSNASPANIKYGK